MPFKIAYVDNDSMFVTNLELLIDILFGIDIFINFMTTYEDPVTLATVTDHKKIAIEYLKGWFLLDVLACFPFQILE